MNPRLLWSALILTAGICVYLGFANRRQDSEIASLRRQFAENSHRHDLAVAELRGRLEDSEAAKVDLQKELTEAKEKAATPPVVVDSVSEKADDPSLDPKHAALMHKRLLREITREYGDAFGKLNLPPDKIARLKDLLLARVQSFSDAFEAARNSGLSTKKIIELGSKTADEVNGEIKTLIGDDGFNQLEQAQRLSGIREMIQTGVALDMTAAGASLTPDQVEKLVATYSEGFPAQGKTTSFPGLEADMIIKRAAVRADALLKKAASYLSPSQVEVLRDSLSSEVEVSSSGTEITTETVYTTHTTSVEVLDDTAK